VYAAGGIRLERLPNTGEEVRAIAGLFPSERRRTRTRAEASEASLKAENLTQVGRLHFATHAVLDERAPVRSGVVLSLVNPGQEDGILRTNEIFNLELDADLVVLSACQTGLGALVRGEGIMGLTRAFLYAGARRVVVSLWEVSDLSTTEFMKSFYQSMRSGNNPGAALRQAKLAMLRSAAPLYRHPYFWAPFVQVGAE